MILFYYIVEVVLIKLWDVFKVMVIFFGIVYDVSLYDFLFFFFVMCRKL